MSSSPHPQPEILGAFLEGRLEGSEHAALVEHLSFCDRCVAMLGGAREAAGADVMTPFPRARRRSWFLAAAAVVLTALAAIGTHQLLRSGDGGVEALIEAAPSSYRTVEGRLTGFRWAPLRHLRSGDTARPDPEALKLAGVAGEVLSEARDDDSAAALRAAGVASLLVRDVEAAAEELRKATSRDPKNGAAWNDLAVTLYTSAARQRRAAALPEALAAADRAIEADGRLVEARFNRALILERMGLQNEAAAAWREYLVLDGASAWAAEARRHLDALPATKPQARFRDRVTILEAAAAAGDRTRVDAELQAFPYEVRGWFEADVLGRWGEAELGGDATAAALLAGARTVAAALRQRSGESLLGDAVAAIDRAPDTDRKALARAHAAYRAGRLAYRDRRLPEAARELRSAALAFEAAGSPMSGMARLYAASLVFDDNRFAGAGQLLEDLLARSGAHHLGLRAQTAVLLGRCHAYACRWSDAVRHYTAAQQDYRRLGEPQNIAETENALGDVYANTGDVETAWQHRLSALQVFGSGGPRLLAALATYARGELRHERWASAEALLRLEVAEAQRIGDPLLVADAYKRRAMLHAQRGTFEAAHADLREARGFASRAADSGLRRRFAAECSLVEGIALRTRDAARSVSALTAATDFARASGDRRLLPEALLERARTHRAAGDGDAAWRDVAAGIDDVEERRAADAGGAGATLEAASSLFEEAVDLLLARGEEERAFEYAERARARGLLDAIDANLATAPAARVDVATVAAALPPDAALVEYALLPDRVAIFRVTRDGLRVAQQPVRRASLESDVRTLRMQMEQRAPVDAIRTTSARLDATLAAPLRALGEHATTIVVGDRVLQSVPWAALWDAARGEYLVERTAVSVAPSAGVWLRNRSRLAAARKDDALLLVTSDVRPELDPLSDLQRERNGLTEAYGRHTLLRDGEATPARFLEQAGAADVVHYAGHARGGSERAEAALLLGNATELPASQIARARLTRPSLVVLAACGTMAGRTIPLEGAPDLARAFLAAGVPTVVGTLWPVGDTDAATLFLLFHQRVRSGSAAPAALRDAQLAMLRGAAPDAAHPAAWAAAGILGGT